MVILRRSEERGHAHHGWLDSRHTFSFADYYDPAEMGFRVLRVINDDRVEAGAGFGMHGHRDMEIISYILDGALQHRDNMGNGSVIRPGDVQRMSAGTGVMHSEFNPSPAEPVHFLQIWIEPNVRGVTPSYEDRHFPEAERRGRLRVVASPDGRDGSTTIHQDAVVYATLLDGADAIRHELAPGRSGYVHVARGQVTVNGQPLKPGDGLKIQDEQLVTFEAAQSAEVLFFDLP